MGKFKNESNNEAIRGKIKLAVILVTVILLTVIVFLVSREGKSNVEVDVNKLSPTLKELKLTTPLNVTTLYIPYNDENYEQLQDVFKSLTPEQRILFKSVSLDKGTKSLIVESLYDGYNLRPLINQCHITREVDSFNEFLKSTTYDPSYNSASPASLLTNKVGNCYAYTLLLMYYIDMYYPDIDYEIVTDENKESNHIYLKLLGQKKDIIVDLTKNLELDLSAFVGGK